jgi:hypothetical protein
VFTWNANTNGDLPDHAKLIYLLNKITVEGVFQLERGLKTDRLHYQGRFSLKGTRLGKKRLLELFQEIADVTNLTFDPEILYDSTKYCIKPETRVSGPWYVGTDSYRVKQQPKEIKLRMWQNQLKEEIKKIDKSQERDRKVIWIQDPQGGAGKSTFLKHLSFGQEDWKVKKLPIDKPDRIRMAICKIVQKEDVDIFAFDFTRTRGEDTSMNDLFQVVEEIKNGHVVSVMYGNPMEVAMTSPHVLIFTNEEISKYKDYLSIDRWEAYQIKDDELYRISKNWCYDPHYSGIHLEKLEKNEGPEKTEPTFKDWDDFKQIMDRCM